VNFSAFSVSVVQPESTPLGIGVRKVAETGILPRLNTDIAHKEPDIGMVGARVLRAPGRCFAEAYVAVGEC
jgi:hypothetical protein